MWAFPGLQRAVTPLASPTTRATSTYSAEESIHDWIDYSSCYIDK